MISPKDILGYLNHEMPVAKKTLKLKEKTGLVLVDLVNGFVTVGAGNLAPAHDDTQISKMTEEIQILSHLFNSRKMPILAFLDTHQPGKAEPPYPPHCEKGSGEENLIDALQWLEQSPYATCIRKDCIDGFIAAIKPEEPHQIIDWVTKHDLETIIICGICTDICVMDFVLSMLSARNHGLLHRLKNIAVYEPGCATYNLERKQAEAYGLQPEAAHPQNISHYMGLYFMASRGAMIVNQIKPS